MNLIKLGIVFGGILSLALAVFHCRFYKRFNWQAEFEKMSLVNSKIFYTLNIALILFFLIFAFMSFSHAEELSRGEGLAGVIVAAYSLFWLWRTVWQVIYFSPSKMNMKQSQLIMHYSLILLFVVLFILYLAPVASRLM
ncbi:MAG: hypothetical protein ACE5IR_19885 [bacterium]